MVIDSLVDKNPGDELIFRLFVTDSTEGKPYQIVIVSNTLTHYETSHPQEPLTLKTFIDRRESRGIKSTAYGYTIVAMKKAEALGFHTILLVGETGNIHELGKANFFAVKGHTLYTPNENLLFGITRKTILEIAKGYGYEVIEGNIHMDFLKEVDEVFSCSTIRGIVPIRKIDDREFSTHTHANRLQTYFQNLSANAYV
jgi:branched-subunit amino acid aminotransferase/4-amino-4-deoxychorismate lyase